MRNLLPFALPVLVVIAGACAQGSVLLPTVPATVQAPTPEQAGRYLFLLGGCNDCHTQGWAESDGKMPEAEWATGSKVGFVGPWGISYPLNLRLTAQEMTEQEWVEMFRQGDGPPPMPWQNYRDASEDGSHRDVPLPQEPRPPRRRDPRPRPARAPSRPGRTST